MTKNTGVLGIHTFNIASCEKNTFTVFNSLDTNYFGMNKTVKTKGIAIFQIVCFLQRQRCDRKENYGYIHTVVSVPNFRLCKNDELLRITIHCTCDEACSNPEIFLVVLEGIAMEKNKLTSTNHV